MSAVGKAVLSTQTSEMRRKAIAAIAYRSPREKQILLDYAGTFNDSSAMAVLQRGRVNAAADARSLAVLYWRIVDTNLPDDIEPWLERIYTTLSIACGNAGFGDPWNKAVPAG